MKITPKLNFHILTLFPEIFDCLSFSILEKAQQKGIIKIKTYDLRKWGLGKRKQVDNKTFGGGAGMVMRVDIVDAAISNIKYQISKRQTKNAKIKTILLTPQGKIFNQKTAARLSKEENLILICGHYEGFDERVRQHLVDEEISVGDYVLTGGEIPAMVLVDSISRLVPGVLGKEESLKEESFQIKNEKVKSKKLLEYPHFTQPRDYKGWKVPEILLSGNHQKISEWRQKEALKKTKKKRPDLLDH